MRKTSWKSMAMLAAMFLFSGAALADDTAKPEKEQTVEDMVVTATRTEERAVDVPVTTQVITRDQIEMSGATHVGDLIGKFITGHYHKYNGLLSPVGLRGFRTESHGDDVKGYVLILVDGHRAGTGNAAKLNIDRIERIEVTKGPSSALYGSAAMGGVINIITKKGDGDVSTTLRFDYGSFDYCKGGVSIGGEAGDKVRFHVSASYEDVGDYVDPEFGTVYNTAETKKNAGLNLSYAFTPRHELRIGGNFGDLTGENPSWTGAAYSSYIEDNRKNYDKSHGYADAEYNGDFFGDSLHWKALGYYLWDRNHWNSGYPVAEDSQTKYTDTTLGTDQQFTWKMVPWNTLVFGFTVESLEKESEAVSKGMPSAPYTPGMEYEMQAYFLQDSLDLFNNRVNIIGAVRHDSFDVTTIKPETGTYKTFDEKSETYDHTSPKLGIGIKFFDEFLRIRANAGEGFKSPSADQLSAEYVSQTNVHYVGNPDLLPETSSTYDIGFDLFHKYFKLRAGYFHTDYDEKIVQTSAKINKQTTVTWTNSGKAEMAGYDLGLEWMMGRTFGWPWDLSLWSNATFNTLKEDKETGLELQFESDYEVKSGLDLKRGSFAAQFTHTLVGPQMITNYDTSPSSIEEKESFEFCDLTLRYRFGKSWEVTGSVLNLFDDRVEWVRGYLMAERNYRAGVSFTF